MLIKDLSKVKDAEITLQDVARAEEIIARANKLLGRKTECNHWHGWNYLWPNTVYGGSWINTGTWGANSASTLAVNSMESTTLTAGSNHTVPKLSMKVVELIKK